MQTTPADCPTTLYNSLSVILQESDWRLALEKMLAGARQMLLFDHIVVFAPPEDDMEILFARAVGRGRTAEAEVDWGVDFAQKVFAADAAIVDYPASQEMTLERTRQPFFWGMPIKDGKTTFGGLVLVRFGGPRYTDEDQMYGKILAALLAVSLARHRAVKMEQRLDRLSRQMRLQEDFVSTITHDLRTPLGFIKGYATTLLRDDTQWDDATRREFLQIIDEEADRLAALIEKILESARLKSNTVEMNFQWMRPDVLVRDATVRALARDKSLQITLDLPEHCPQIYADSTRLSQVLENLFSNAAKYAPQAPISIRLQADDDWMYLVFSDAGPGIAEEHQAFIFERFYRAAPGTGVKGTGLGLYICREIVRAHGGEIWVESQPGAGTTFFIKLPIHPDKDGKE